ncbi:hypothetical protein OOY67_000661 [Vibrio parahaemolyticus]|nr:hypothetical protein [Vibrio parahaemolyticus]
MIIRNTTTGTAWNLPDGTKLPKGMYANINFVETLPDELKDDIKRDMELNDSRLHMNEHFDMTHTFKIEKPSIYTRHAKTLGSSYKDAKGKGATSKEG